MNYRKYISRLWVAGLLAVSLPRTVEASHQWARALGGGDSDYFSSVQQTSDGGYVLAGRSLSFGDAGDLWVVKLDAAGAVSWEKVYGGDNNDRAGEIRQTSDGGYIVATSTYSFGAGSSDAWILKLDGSGGVVWEKTYGSDMNDSINGMELTSDGGCVVTGATRGFGAAGFNQWIMKLSAVGTVEWSNRRYVDQNESGMAVSPIPGGGYVVIGSAVGNGGSDDIWFTQLSANGSFVRKHLIGSDKVEYGAIIARAGDGGWFVAGAHLVAWDNSDGLIMKLNSTGGPVWQKRIGGPGDDSFYRGCATGDGGFIAVGTATNLGSGGRDVWVVQVDSTGQVAWQKAYGGSDTELASDVWQTSDGGYVLAGRTDSFGNGSDDGFVLRLSPTGDIDPSCGSLVTNTSATAADLSVTDDTGFLSFVGNVAPTVNTPVYATSSTAATQTLVCIASCSVSCSATVPASGVVGSAVAFTSNASLVDCAGASVSYAWTFGDGAGSVDQNPSHAYGAPGTYPWALTATAPGATPCVQSGSITISATAMPDLTGGWTSMKKKGSKISASLSCQNIGPGDAGGFTVKIYFSRKTTISRKSTLIKTQTVSSLAAGGSVPISIKATPAKKHKYLVAVVDSAGTVGESNETNNSVVGSLP